MSTGRAPIPVEVERPCPGRALVFVPHADDDVLGLGGTLTKYADAGDVVKVVVAYDGLAGDPEGRYEPEVLRALRQDEARRGGAHLGLSDYEFWDQPEGHMPGPSQLAEAAARVVRLLDDFKPDVVFAPHIGECHLDHHVLALVVRMGLINAAFEGRSFGYEVWTPLVAEVVVDITAVNERKIAALKEHASQLEYNDFVHKALGLSAQRSLFLPKSARYGEAFCELLEPDGA